MGFGRAPAPGDGGGVEPRRGCPGGFPFGHSQSQGSTPSYNCSVMAEGPLLREFTEPGEMNRFFAGARPPTEDDVSITFDGRRLDTVEKVLAFAAELEEIAPPAVRVAVHEQHVALDIERLTECLHRHQVDYLLVGGLGAQLHGGS